MISYSTDVYKIGSNLSILLRSKLFLNAPSLAAAELSIDLIKNHQQSTSHE